LVAKHKNVVLTIGAGNQANLIAPYSSQTQNLSHMMLHLPPVSPMKNSNPGYTILEFDNKGLSEIRFRHLQLYNFIMYKAKKWSETQFLS
jgi:hypothetical protein